MLNEQELQAFSVKPSKRIRNMADLLNVLKRGRESGETHGWLSPEDMREHFSRKVEPHTIDLIDDRP